MRIRCVVRHGRVAVSRVTNASESRSRGRAAGGAGEAAQWTGDSANRLRVLILGSTGSIGTQALEVIADNPDRFEVVGLAAGGGNPDLLARQRAETWVTNVAVADPVAAEQVGEVGYSGPDAVTRLVETPRPTSSSTRWSERWAWSPPWPRWQAARGLALANKESLVAGGPLVLRAAQPGQIVPVDSEHSALAQCLRAGSPDEVASWC